MELLNLFKFWIVSDLRYICQNRQYSNHLVTLLLSLKKVKIKEDEKILQNKVNLRDNFKLKKLLVRTNRQTFKHKIEK